MVYFGDIKPFIDENEDIGPATRPKLLHILSDPQKVALLQIELAATIDLGEPFVKACYFLEGDGPLALYCYEAIETIRASIQAGHMPNVNAMAQRLSSRPLSDQLCKQWVDYAKCCIQPGLDYFEKQLASNLSSSFMVFKSCRLFSPQKVNSMQPDAAAVQDALSVIPFFNSGEVDSLKEELPSYLALVADTDANFSPLEWWKSNSNALPNWSAAARKIFLIQPTSATVERVFLY